MLEHSYSLLWGSIGKPGKIPRNHFLSNVKEKNLFFRKPGLLGLIFYRWGYSLGLTLHKFAEKKCFNIINS
jgi:hypothetical protein